MRLKQALSQVPRIADWLSRRDQIVLQQALHQELSYVQRTPAALNNFEQRFYSQNGEDGIIQEILRRIGVTNRYFVEFGIQNGVETCCRYLLERHSWQGVWIEANDASAQLARNRFGALPVQILNQFLTRENILQVFAQAGVPAEFDLLVIDVDGNDYWLWQTISTGYSPRLLVIEYNGAFTPDEYWVMPYNPAHRWQRDWHFGASLKASARLARERGYELVACDSQGVNAFFVRRDLLSDQFTDAGSLRWLYRTYKYNPLWYGPAPSLHVQLASPTTEPVAPSTIHQLRLTCSQPADRLRVKVGTLWYLPVDLDNSSTTSLISALPYPVRLAYHWIIAAQDAVEGHRTPLAPPSEPNTHHRYWVRVNAPAEPGQYTLRVGLVQEHILWFFQSNPDCAVSISVEVVL